VAAIRSSGRNSADEWAFRGRLAWRLSVIFNLEAFGTSPVEVPEAPAKHDVQVPAHLLCSLPKGSLSKELESLNAAEMTCWKWSHEYNRRASALRYVIRLSTSRPVPAPDVNSDGTGPLYRVKLTPPSVSELKKRFFRGRPEPVVRFFLELLRMQDFSTYEALPPYSSVELEMAQSTLADPDVKDVKL